MTYRANIYDGLIGPGWVSIVGRSPSYSQGTLGFAAGNGGNYQSAQSFPYVSSLWQYRATTTVALVRLVYGAFAYGTDIGSDLPLQQVTIEYPQGSGTFYDFTFSAASTVSVPNGLLVVSDPVAIPVVKGVDFNVRNYLAFTSPTSTTYWPSYDASRSGDKLYASATPNNQTHASYASHASNSSAGYGPLAVLGYAQGAESLGTAGDSIQQGVGDQYTASGATAAPPAGVGLGYVARAIAAARGFCNVSRHAETAAQFLTSTTKHRLKLAATATRVLEAYGINDIRINNIAAFDLMVNRLLIWKWLALRGIDVWAGTMPPNSTSTDTWATVANQTVSNAGQNTVRITVNNWIRDGAPINSLGFPVPTGTVGALRAGSFGHPLRGYVELADAVESSRDSGLWKADGRVITDAAITSGTNQLTSVTANFTAADTGRTARVAGAGAAGATLVATLTYVNATTVTTSANAGTTVSGATASIGTPSLYTGDGLHPAPAGHVAMSVPVAASAYAA